ncbi:MULTISPECIES: aspartyl/asparaginyl beta-hydroxylase domain-containing protein [Pseudomonadaceae]|uniref:Aspartyl/asparaginyl beta-hydroxylase domain-containing protein n=1 Tax=Stutzerimonas kunmingensis TaxID=1211807 RepID=A0A9X1N687_9GAMM|nr:MULTISPECIES: aspartyl/asparaginyl beta-hydroxylase domain-containing protein [Pseudomonadaceae]MBB60417.1 aspartyl beta-hydroxylase [Pseudomonas sp.]MBP2697840.1 aspartyl/asparaginyl beta-hydroxylase domain-containing protein [Pseudomonas aeruginosa]MCD1610550.1 aspartyl/asparaginyl beta-hydroxylase domain-containing protein [Stutzerimonas kunmingensis]QTB75902.1 aspartyl/asparaginyl beta-hydroxylase domain-containing protein [Pseudomonas aeruginosa]QTB88042.1 aspartyl/asparaginyl beta-hyd
MNDMASAVPKKDKVKRSMLYQTGKKLRPLLNRFLSKHSLVGDPPVFDKAAFPWTAELERHWPVIRAELDALLRQGTAIPALRDISPDHRRIAEGSWRSFFLWGYGYRIDEGCRRCPRTAEALAVVPGLNSAFFSILEPGAHIPRHTGVTKRIMTCHLGVVTPTARERCRIQVGPETRHWCEGECLVFDDTYPHEVWNDTEQTRVVLLIQFKRPLRLPGRLLGDLFLGAVRCSPFVQEARRNLAAWDQAHKLLDD